LAPAEAEIEAVRYQKRQPVARIVAEQLAIQTGCAHYAATEPAARGGGMPAFALVRAGVAFDRGDRCGECRRMRIAAAQHERAGAQAVGGGKYRIVRERAFNDRQRVSVRAEKARERLLEVFERSRVAGRRDQSGGVAQCGHMRMFAWEPDAVQLRELNLCGFFGDAWISSAVQLTAMRASRWMSGVSARAGRRTTSVRELVAAF